VGRRSRIGEERRAPPAREPRSKVTFDIEAVEDLRELTDVHDDFDPDSTVLERVSQGWPRVRSDLETLLETARSRSPDGIVR
jgi:hypothetical protein